MDEAATSLQNDEYKVGEGIVNLLLARSAELGTSRQKFHPRRLDYTTNEHKRGFSSSSTRDLSTSHMAKRVSRCKNVDRL